MLVTPVSDPGTFRSSNLTTVWMDRPNVVTTTQKATQEANPVRKPRSETVITPERVEGLYIAAVYRAI